MRILTIAAAFLLLCGCATGPTQATLTVISQPAGAYVTEIDTGRTLGMAPVNSFYDVMALVNSPAGPGCWLVKGFNAQWASGATGTTGPTVKLCGVATGSYNITINRDPSYPNLEADLNVAIGVQNLQIQQQIQAAQQAQAQQQLNQNAAQLGSALGCALAGGCVTRPPATQPQVVMPQQCTYDHQCGARGICLKSQGAATGICAAR